MFDSIAATEVFDARLENLGLARGASCLRTLGRKSSLAVSVVKPSGSPAAQILQQGERRGTLELVAEISASWIARTSAVADRASPSRASGTLPTRGSAGTRVPGALIAQLAHRARAGLGNAGFSSRRSKRNRLQESW
jgi:hypothetical protein